MLTDDAVALIVVPEVTVMGVDIPSIHAGLGGSTNAKQNQSFLYMKHNKNIDI